MTVTCYDVLRAVLAAFTLGIKCSRSCINVYLCFLYLGCSNGEVQAGYWEKAFHPEGGQALEQAP